MTNDLPATRQGEPQVIERLAETFAMEYLTGHYRPLRADEQKSYDQLKVVILAFAANALTPLRAEVARLREERDASEAARVDHFKARGLAEQARAQAESRFASLFEERDALRAHHRLCQCPVDGYDHEDCVFRLSSVEARARLAALSTALEGLEQEMRETADCEWAASLDKLNKWADRLAALRTLEAEK